jgi:uncharacterized integral membrane protein
MAKRRGILGEFMVFLKQHKAYWMIPIIILLLLLILLAALGTHFSALSPFLYAM